MQTPQIDPIIAEIRAIREEHAARFGYDVKAIFNDIQAKQRTSGRNYVRYHARRTYPKLNVPATPRPYT